VAQICLSLTGRSIAEDLSVLERYRGLIDLVELRADYLEASEMLHLRSFPERAGLPCILTVRRRVDGGVFEAGEGVRLVMIAKGLTHARTELGSNFAFVDLESDFRVPAIEEVCRIFGTRVIRSIKCLKKGIEGFDEAWAAVSSEADEIPKIVVTCEGASELAGLARWSEKLPPRDRIIVGVGPYGFPTRVLAEKLGSYLVYTSALNAGLPSASPGHTDPKTLLDLYRFREIGKRTKVYGLAGGPAVITSRAPEVHNAAFGKAGIDAVYLPFPSKDADSFIDVAEAMGVQGASVSVPLKEDILDRLATITDEARSIGACNTIHLEAEGWSGFNTDAIAFERDLRDFLGREDLEGLRVTLLGAGGAAHAVAHVLSRLGASGLVLNRTLGKARSLAKAYGFVWSTNEERSHDLVVDHADLIINATALGMEGGEPGDPLEWYEFSGRERVYDLIYRPDRTVFLRRAEAAGCQVRNGWGMLRFQAAEQFRIWTGLEPPSIYFE
jgi:3-dehydroquinate dehydratase/shikimate dehydrogenase